MICQNTGVDTGVAVFELYPANLASGPSEKVQNMLEAISTNSPTLTTVQLARAVQPAALVHTAVPVVAPREHVGEEGEDADADAARDDALSERRHRRDGKRADAKRVRIIREQGGGSRSSTATAARGGGTVGITWGIGPRGAVKTSVLHTTIPRSLG